MLEQIELISHLGRFQYICPDNMPNKGKLKKINLIYAPNGSGKTSLSLIFQSIAENKPSLILKKRDRIYNKNTIIKLRFTHKTLDFNGEKWETVFDNISIKTFNSFFITDNTYIFNLEANGFSANDILTPNDRVSLKKQKEEMAVIKRKLNQARSTRRGIRHRLKKMKSKKKYSKNNKVAQRLEKLDRLVEKLETSFGREQHNYSKMYYEALRPLEYSINEKLKDFAADFSIKIQKVIPVINHKITRIVFDIVANNKQKTILINNKSSRDSFDYVLSDGDKSSLAFALYSSMLLKNSKISSQIVFVDDPFTSLDQDRQFKTARILANLSKKVEQIIITSHSKYFLQNLYSELINTQIKPDNILSLSLVKKDQKTIVKDGDFKPEIEPIMGEYILFKDYCRGEKILTENNMDDIMKRIRPFLERILKFKFPEFYVEGQTWLKSYLDFIRKSKDDPRYERFVRLQEYEELFGDILSFTKKYNHDSMGQGKHTIRECTMILRETLQLFDAI